MSSPKNISHRKFDVHHSTNHYSGDKMAPDVGPHPGVIKVSRQYYFEHLIHRKMSKPGVDPAREEDYRLKGVQLIYELKQELLLYVLADIHETPKY